MPLTNKIVIEAYEKVQGNGKKLHNLLCDMAGKKCEIVQAKVLQMTVKRLCKNAKRLKYARNKNYTLFMNKEFRFPESQMSKQNPMDDSKKDIVIKHLNHQIYQMKIKNTSNSKQLSGLKLKIKRQNQVINKLKGKLKELNKNDKVDRYELDKKCNDAGTQCNTLKKMVNELKIEIDQMRIELEERDEINETETEKTVILQSNTKGKRYSESIRKVIYEFLSRKIGLQHINPLIKSVLSMVNIEVENLPSITTENKMVHELGTISKLHVAESISNNECITMHRDATTKKGRHFYGVELKTNATTYTAGLREVPNGKAETYVQCTKDILNDITNNNYTSILDKTKSFMTDRSATESKTNRLLIDQQNTQNNETLEFKCAVHPLLQFADVCNKYMSSIEGIKDDIKASNLLKFIGKLFYKDGSGDPLYAKTYLQEKGIKNIPIMNNRGSRFNTLFYNAAGTFYLKPFLDNYFKNVKSTLNYTQNYIFQSLKCDDVLSICRALGIIFKIITEPYLQASSNENINALDMGSVYNRLIEILGSGSENPTLFSKNQISLFFGPFLPEQTVTKALFEPSQLDEKTQHHLSKICSLLKDKCQVLFKDFLIDGQFHKPSETVAENARTCPPNNITVERLMARLDSQLKSGPTSNTQSIENRIMFKTNNTGEWLRSKSNEEQAKIIQSAVRINNESIDKCKERKRKLHEDHVIELQRRESDKKRKVEKKESEKLKLLEILNNIGIWESEEKIREEIGKLRTKSEKTKALKKQINLLKEFTKLTASEKHLTQFSSKGKQHSDEKLIENIITLLDIKKSQEKIEIETNALLLVGKKIKHTWDVNGKEEIWNGEILKYETGYFEIKYWNLEKSNSSNYWLEVGEINHDIKENTLTFIE